MQSDTEKADEISRRHARMSPFLGLAVLVAHQGVFFNWDWDAVNFVAMAIWSVLTILVLVVAVSGGYWFTPRRVRELANDDVTRANRSKAIARGFVAAMVTAITVFVVAPFEPLSAQRAAHLIFSFGLAVTLLVFGLEESKTLA